MIWTPRGKDRSGADTWISVTPHGTFWITDHKLSGVQIWKGDGLGKELLSTNRRSVEAAKEYMLRRLGK